MFADEMEVKAALCIATVGDTQADEDDDDKDDEEDDDDDEEEEEARVN